MHGNPIKFRCYRCNRLLGVAAHKAGTVVSCPKCAAELLVPPSDAAEPNADPGQALRGLVVTEPRAGDEAPRAGSDALPNFPVSFDPPGAGPGPGPGPVAGTAPAFPAIETEPITLRSAPAPTPSEPAGGFPMIQTEPEPLRSEPAARRSRRARPEPEPEPEPTPPEIAPAPLPWPSSGPGVPTTETIVPATRLEPESRSPGPLPTAPPIPTATVVPALAAPLAMVPPLAVEPPTSLTERGPTARRNDVVIPRSAVLLWSFTMLLALVAAFAAGLLAGHFLWNNPPARPVSVPAVPPGP